MNVFPIEPKFPIGEVGFKGTYKDDNGQDRPLDLLGRTDFGQRLTSLVDSTSQPLVIALDGPWGSGKSHFLKLWAGAHGLELKGQAEVIYFDAFEHDFLDDPLVSLVAKLAKDAPERGFTANAMEKVKDAAGPLLRLGARIAVAVGTAGVSEMVGAVGDAAIGAIGKSAEDNIDEFWKTETSRIAAMSEFRAALEALTKKEDGTTQKIVFIIDELDRCRPDYALQMLEIIKHFFTVPNVHFVLGANLSELENSVKARYGAGINARKYLQKFVMLEMRLPYNRVSRDPSDTAVNLYLEGCKVFLALPKNVRQDMNSFVSFLDQDTSLTIRDMQRIISVISLFPRSGQATMNGWRSVLVAIAFISVLNPKVYKQIRSFEADFEEVESCLRLTKRSSHLQNVFWHYLGFLLLDTETFIAKGADAQFREHAESLLSERFGIEPKDVLRREISICFDTFTLPDY